MLRSFACLLMLGLAGLGARRETQAKPLIPVGVHSPLQGHRDVVTGRVALTAKTVCEDLNGDGVVDRCRRVMAPAEPTLAAPKRTPGCTCNPCRCVNCACGTAQASAPERSVVKKRFRLRGCRRCR
jgi:hypothetical protein